MKRKYFLDRKGNKLLPSIYGTFQVLFLHGSPPIISDLLFNLCQAKVRATCERLEATHFESRSHQKNSLYCSKCIDDFANENVSAQQPIIRRPRRLKL